MRQELPPIAIIPGQTPGDFSNGVEQFVRIDSETENELGWQYGQYMAGWQALEKKLADEEKSDPLIIVDLDFRPRGRVQTRTDFTNREAVGEQLALLKEQLNAQTEIGHYLTTKIEGSLTFLDALAGKEIPYLEYLRKTMGIAPEFLPPDQQEKALGHMFAQVTGMLAEFGYDNTQTGWQRYIADHRLSHDQVRQQFEDAAAKLFPIYDQALGVEAVDYREHLDIAVRPVNKYWVCWFKTRRGKFLLEFNTHPRHDDRWFDGAPEYLLTHEGGGHFKQAYGIRQNVQHDLISPAYATATIHTAEQPGLEGSADSISILVPEVYEAFSPAAQLLVARQQLTSSVYAALDYRANTLDLEDPKNFAETVEFVQTFLPFMTEQKIRLRVDDVTKDPQYRAYLASYWLGAALMEQEASTMTVDQRHAFLAAQNQKLRTPHQLQVLAREIRQTA